MAKQPYYQIIRNQAGRYGDDAAEIYIYGEIGTEVNPNQFVNELKGLRNVTKMDIHVHSPGGELFSGLLMYNALKQHPSEKTFYIDGIAASSASLVCMAPGIVVMPDETSYLMIHDPTVGGISGRAEDLRQTADRIDQAKKSLVAAYVEKTGMSEGQISDLMAAETWMQAREAKRYGFCDEISQPLKIAAKIDLSKFKNLPKELQDKLSGEKLPDRTKKEVFKKMEDKTNVQNDSWKKDLYAERERTTGLVNETATPQGINPVGRQGSSLRSDALHPDNTRFPRQRPRLC